MVVGAVGNPLGRIQFSATREAPLFSEVVGMGLVTVTSCAGMS